MYRFTLGRGVLWLGLLFVGTNLCAQSGGTVKGTVKLDQTGKAVHGVSILIVQLGLTTETDDSGRFRFENVGPGTYDLVAHAGAISAPTQLVQVTTGETVEVELTLKISPIRQEVTITARGVEETAFRAVQSVTSVDSYSLAENLGPSLGEVLENQSGVSKRSFGPGSSRPVIRGFDGDRVLVMQDGIRVGSLASQSGDHGDPINPGSLERVEIVRGPSTLLYGSNAIGGVVNAVTGHHERHQDPHQGLTGQVTTGAGTTNEFAAGNAKLEFGQGNWLFWGGGGGQRSGDYDTPIGEVENSKHRITNASAGLGYFGSKAYLSFGYGIDDGRYGIPGADAFHGHEEEEGEHEEEEEELEGVDISFERHNYRVSTGLRNLNRGLRGFDFSLTYTDWEHSELELLTGGEEEIGTVFDNKQWVYRGVLEQAPAGLLAGRFGFWGLVRDYDVVGAEALSPPVDQNSFALFALEELQFKRAKIQFGGRVEFTDYQVLGLQLRGHGHEEHEEGGEEEEGEEEEPELVALPDRDFTAFSAGIGARFDVGRKGAFIANFTSSARAPALEELYNFGPHVGNLAFEVGDPTLEQERSNGVDFSYRHHGERVHANASFFYYDINDFIFLQRSGEVVDGLLEGDYTQGDSRFVGTEFRFDAALHEKLWLKLGLDLVDAELTDLNQSLPRIPPLRGRVGLDFRHRGLSLRPELVMADRQDELALEETPTAGYTVLNLKASYTIPRQHFLHQFSLEFFNVGDRLYRNHVSFIKDLAPEMGRGARFVYTMKFF